MKHAILPVLVMACSLVHAETFPDQPGVLSAEALDAARAEFQAVWQSEPYPELVASGRIRPEWLNWEWSRGSMDAMTRDQDSTYVLFATPFTDHSERTRIRTVSPCSGDSTGMNWFCQGTRALGLHITADGIEHEFATEFHVRLETDEKVQKAEQVIDFMHSSCFDDEYRRLGGDPSAPGFQRHAVGLVYFSLYKETVHVYAGPKEAEDLYLLRRTGAAPGECGFEFFRMRIGASGTILPVEYAKQLEEREAQSEVRKAKALARQKAEELGKQRAQREQEARAKERAKYEAWAGTALGISVLTALVAVFVPWFLLSLNPLYTAGVVFLFAALSTSLYSYYGTFGPGGMDQASSIIFLPLILLAWVSFLGFALRALPAGTSRVASGRDRVRFVVLLVLSVLFVIIFYREIFAIIAVGGVLLFEIMLFLFETFFGAPPD